MNATTVTLITKQGSSEILEITEACRVLYNSAAHEVAINVCGKRTQTFDVSDCVQISININQQKK